MKHVVTALFLLCSLNAPAFAEEQISDAPSPADTAPISSAPVSVPHNATGFMVNFCSASYTPAIKLDTVSQACQESQRQQACERFHHATIDVQRLLDRAINCEYNASTDEKNTEDCDGLDAGRLDLLKQYWQDEESSYTILFLPDMVLNSATTCSTTQTHKPGLKE